MRALKIAGAAIAGILIVALGLSIVGVPSGYLTSAIQSRVEHDTGYRLTIAGATKIGVWPSLNITLNDVTLDNPNDNDASRSLTVGRIEADMTLASVWAGHPKITALSIVRPVMNVPLLRERTVQPAPPTSRPAAAPSEPPANAAAIDHVTIKDGAIAFSNLRDRVNDRIDGIDADITIGSDRQIGITGSANTNGHPLTFTLKATAPALPLERQNIPVELSLDTGLLQAPVSAKAEIRLNGSVVMINGLSGAIGDGAFNGWASVDFSSKPLVKLDLDFQRLDIAKPAATAVLPSQDPQNTQPSPPWSNVSIDVNGLNYVDAQLRISAAQLNVGSAHFAPVAVETSLASGVLKSAFSNWGAYDGQISGELSADVSTGNPVYALHSDLVGVRALPLLRDLADFDKVDGKMQAKLALRSSGNSQRAVMSNLDGTIFTNFRDGAITGLNVAQMIRSLTSGALSGWQETRDQSTDLSQLSASFRVEKGQATTGDLNLVGPLVRMTGAGTIDIGEKSLAFRVEPKLVMTTEGQGRANDPVGLGIPVVIDGPWANPRISPDVAGMTDNPDAAYSKLKEMGKGLFGTDGNGSGNGSLGETLGNLIQQGLGQSKGQPGSASGRSIPPPARADPAPQTPPDSQPMNDVLKQLFNR